MPTAIKIGSLLLTDANSPKVNMKNDYYTTDSNMIIGGKRVITINGTVSVSDDGSTTGATVMRRLKEIRDTGKSSKCVDVTIAPYYSGRARIQAVNIEQGSDPSWVNIGAFSITVEAPLDSIPQNSLGIVASDNVKSLSFSEKIDIGEDGHGFVYTKDNSLSKAYVKFSCKVSVEIDPICKNIDNRTSLENLIRRFMKTAPTHRLLNRYSGWRVFGQDRTYELSSANTASFNLEAILLSPSSRSVIASVDLNFKHNKTYETGEETKTISGNIKGLVPIPWGDIFSIQGLSAVSKMGSAESAFSYIRGVYNNISNWDGIEYELNKQICANNEGQCEALPPTGDGTTKKDCMKPSNASVGRARTEGSIDFTFDWINSDKDCAKNNSNTITTEYSVDDQKAQPSVVEHTIPTVGILLQNLQCFTARKISFTSVVNLPAGSCPGTRPPCTTTQESDLDLYIRKYFASRLLTQADYMLIEHTNTETTKSNTIKKGYISVCLTEVT